MLTSGFHVVTSRLATKQANNVLTRKNCSGGAVYTPPPGGSGPSSSSSGSSWMPPGCEKTTESQCPPGCGGGSGGGGAAQVPLMTLNNGRKCPVLGLGTWTAWKTDPSAATQPIKDAIDIGYRHFDCAFLYGNEKDIGKGMAEKIADGTVKREDLFVVSKLWNTYHRPDLVCPAAEVTVNNFGLDYIDLYLVHFPYALKEGGGLFPADKDGKALLSDVDYVDTWKAMEQVQEAGLSKSIGISNFNSKQIDRLLKCTKIVPVCNQVECHPYLDQSRLKNFCEERGIKIVAYSPLGSPDRPWALNEPNLMEEPKVKAIAQRLGKTVGQILIRYQIDLGHIVIPKTVKKERMIANFNVFDFKLTPEDVKTLQCLNRNVRYVPMDEAKHHKDWPFKEAF